jgi:hypothetical protein
VENAVPALTTVFVVVLISAFDEIDVGFLCKGPALRERILLQLHHLKLDVVAD